MLLVVYLELLNAWCRWYTVGDRQVSWTEIDSLRVPRAFQCANRLVVHTYSNGANDLVSSRYQQVGKKGTTARTTIQALDNPFLGLIGDPPFVGNLLSHITFISKRVGIPASWHRQLGHIGLYIVCRIPGKQFLRMHVNISSPIGRCNTGLEPKQVKYATTKTIIACGNDHTVNLNVAGPIQLTIGKSRYTVTFIEERSLVLKDLYLKLKIRRSRLSDNVLSLAQEDMSSSHKEISFKPGKRVLDTWNISPENGIDQTISYAFSSESNGFAHPYNRTLLANIWAMIVNFGLSFTFLWEGASHAEYLNIAMATGSHDGNTHLSCYFGWKPNLSRL